MSRISAAKLLEALEPGTYVLRSEDLKKAKNPQLAFTEALAMAVRGEIEGIATQAGRVKYLRLLPVEERALAPPMREDLFTGESTAFAHTHLGVFREAIRAAVVTESFGHRQAIASGEITGHVWTHCQMRKERQASRV